MSRAPAGFAWRLDRLAWRLHAFHRYAHHPLCRRYAGEVLTLGRVRVCKGCTLLAVGVVVGVPVGCLVPGLSVTNLALVALAALAWALTVFWAPDFVRWGTGNAFPSSDDGCLPGSARIRFGSLGGCTGGGYSGHCPADRKSVPSARPSPRRL